jgi:phenylpyruvate tautomerase PptA (4-oxalocrotonate tautomerase family)
MPTYTVTVANLSLIAEQENFIAGAITESHQANTGAPGFFAQVFFNATAAGKHFIGGKISRTSQVFVHGLIRAGRSADATSNLIKDIAEKVAEIAGLRPEDVWVYLQDIPAAQMVEFGRVLPEPGAEQEWLQGLGPRKIRELTDAGVLG